MSGLRTLRLVCAEFWADVRLRQVGGHWLASAHAPHGSTLGIARYPIEALAHALEPFDGYLDELLATVPNDLYWR